METWAGLYEFVMLCYSCFFSVVLVPLHSPQWRSQRENEHQNGERFVVVRE